MRFFCASDNPSRSPMRRMKSMRGPTHGPGGPPGIRAVEGSVLAR